MTEQEFYKKAAENVRQIVNCIADHEYSKLQTVTEINLEVHHHFKTQSEAMNQLTTWLDDQLKIWSEYENKKCIVDYFNEKYFDFKIDRFDRKKAFGSYMPHSYGEELCFIFEFDFIVDVEDVTSRFSINV